MNGLERQRIHVLMMRIVMTANLIKCPTVKADGSRDNYPLSACYKSSSVLEICSKLMNLGCSFDMVSFSTFMCLLKLCVFSFLMGLVWRTFCRASVASQNWYLERHVQLWWQLVVRQSAIDHHLGKSTLKHNVSLAIVPFVQSMECTKMFLPLLSVKFKLFLKLDFACLNNSSW